MDPNATWMLLLDCLAVEDPDSVDHAYALHAWIQGGGMPPSITGKEGLRRLDEVLARVTCEYAAGAEAFPH